MWSPKGNTIHRLQTTELERPSVNIISLHMRNPEPDWSKMVSTGTLGTKELFQSARETHGSLKGEMQLWRMSLQSKQSLEQLIKRKSYGKRFFKTCLMELEKKMAEQSQDKQNQNQDNDEWTQSLSILPSSCSPRLWAITTHLRLRMVHIF